MLTIRDWFSQTFNEFDSRSISDESGLLACTFERVRLMSASYDQPEHQGSLQVTCGGDVLIEFKPRVGMRGAIFLIRDDSAGNDWTSRSEPLHIKGHRPHARLRLVYSA